MSSCSRITLGHGGDPQGHGPARARQSQGAIFRGRPDHAGRLRRDPRRAVVIHAARDLRIEEHEPEKPGPLQVEVAVECGGICGSDLHYVQSRRLRHGAGARAHDPGPRSRRHHQGGGRGVSGLSVGERVAISPSRPCNASPYCLQGAAEPLPGHAASTAVPCRCRTSRAPSARPSLPRRAGSATRSLMACRSTRRPSPSPSRVTLHAVARAGSLLGKRVLVTQAAVRSAPCAWCPPARTARERSSPPDIVNEALEKARQVGADRTINVVDEPGRARRVLRQQEAISTSTSRRRAISRPPRSGLEVLKPRGVLVQLGIGGDVSIPAEHGGRQGDRDAGTFRFHEEFGLAVNLINKRAVDVKPLLTGVYGLGDALKAFEIAGDPHPFDEVQISFCRSCSIRTARVLARSRSLSAREDARVRIDHSTLDAHLLGKLAVGLLHLLRRSSSSRLLRGCWASPHCPA